MADPNLHQLALTNAYTYALTALKKKKGEGFGEGEVLGKVLGEFFKVVHTSGKGEGEKGIPPPAPWVLPLIAILFTLMVLAFISICVKHQVNAFEQTQKKNKLIEETEYQKFKKLYRNKNQNHNDITRYLETTGIDIPQFLKDEANNYGYRWALKLRNELKQEQKEAELSVVVEKNQPLDENQSYVHTEVPLQIPYYQFMEAKAVHNPTYSSYEHEETGAMGVVFIGILFFGAAVVATKKIWRQFSGLQSKKNLKKSKLQ